MAELVSMRKAYGEALVKLGQEYPDVVVLSADVSNSDHSYMFQDAFPERFFNVGIAEQCLVDVAVGLAYNGKIPFANTFAFLFATRALEMVRTHLCYGQANVKLMGAYAGLSDSFDGPTHHSITDIAIMRSLPNMTIIVPSDPVCLAKLLPQVAEWPGPVFMRLNRNEVPVLFADQYHPEIGKAVTIREGDDVAIISAGLMLSKSLEAARQTRAFVTVEEHSIIGGLGGAIAELLADKYPIPIKRVGLRDCFAESGPYNDILDKYGMSVDCIYSTALEAIAMKP
jgi:transketolase